MVIFEKNFSTASGMSEIQKPDIYFVYNEEKLGANVLTNQNVTLTAHFE